MAVQHVHFVYNYILNCMSKYVTVHKFASSLEASDLNMCFTNSILHYTVIYLFKSLLFLKRMK